MCGSGRTECGANTSFFIFFFSGIDLIARVVASSGLFGTWALFILLVSCGLPRRYQMKNARKECRFEQTRCALFTIYICI